MFYIKAIQHRSLQLVPDVKYNGDEEDNKFGLLCERRRKGITEIESMKAFNGNNHKQRPIRVLFIVLQIAVIGVELVSAFHSHVTYSNTKARITLEIIDLS
jgi:hypothetical protein